MTTYNDIRALASSALHTTVRIHHKNGKFQVYKNGEMVCESENWGHVKEIALGSSSSPTPDRSNKS